ncbi:MAG: hypothetical protein ABEJ30_05070 [Halorientalis sp.]
MSRLVEQAVVALTGVLVVGLALFPRIVGPALSPVTSRLVAGITWASETLPRAAFLVLILLVLTVVVVLYAIALARACYPLLAYAGPRTSRLWDLITPNTPLGKMATGIMLLMGIVMGSIYGLPMAFGDLSENSTVSQADDLANRGLNVDPITFDQQDLLASGAGAAQDASAYDRPRPDADGDRLRDSWEVAGETPGGAALPGADPRRMDLYVQVNYGAGTHPLRAAEKRQLRRVWSEMPVENPDGSTGVDVHVVDSRPRGGPLGERVQISGTSYAGIHQWYTPALMGPRACRYQQVVVGSIGREGVRGIATTPGYAAVVEDITRDWEGIDVSPRVAVITHELLHNVAGSVTQSGHVSRGWLAESVGAGDTQLSNETTAKLNADGFVGSGYFQHEVCSG